MREALSIWTLYDHPKDFPDHIVARRFEYETPTSDVLLADDLSAMRAEMMARGLTCLTRSPGDDPVIIEVWL